jgi:hypothetical protein
VCIVSSAHLTAHGINSSDLSVVVTAKAVMLATRMAAAPFLFGTSTVLTMSCSLPTWSV